MDHDETQVDRDERPADVCAKCGGEVMERRLWLERESPGTAVYLPSCLRCGDLGSVVYWVPGRGINVARERGWVR